MGAPTLNRMIDNRPKAETAATSAAAISLLLRSVSYSSASLQALQCGLSPDTLHPDLHSIFDYLDDIVRSQTCRLVEAVTDQVRPALTVRTIHGSAIVCHRVDKRSVERTWNVLSISSPCRYWLCRRQRHIARMCRWKRFRRHIPMISAPFVQRVRTQTTDQLQACFMVQMQLRQTRKARSDDHPAITRAKRAQAAICGGNGRK